MQRYTVLSLLFYLCALLPAGAQPYCAVKTFNLRDGLASNIITGIEQTSDGLMWFSTWSGLACYDGYRFTNYFDIPDEEGTEGRVLTTNRLLAASPDVNGNIWCTTYDLFPYFFDREKGSYTDIMKIIRTEFDTEFACNGVIPMKNGHVWLLSVNAGVVARIDGHTALSPQSIKLFRNGEGILEGKQFNWVYEDNEGEEWLCTDRCLIRLKDGWESPEAYLYIRQVGSHIYMATAQGHIAEYDKQTGNLRQLPLPPEVTRTGLLHTAADRWLVTSTDIGLYVYDTAKKTGGMVYLPQKAKPMENGREVYGDKQGRFWMLYGNGEDVLKVKLDNLTYSLLPTADRMPPLTQSNRTLFHEDDEGTVWTATAKGFFGYYDETRDEMVSYPLRTVGTQPVIDKWRLDKQGNLWFSNNHNLAMVQFKHRHIRHLTDNSEVRSVLFDHHGRLWTGFRSGKLTCTDTDGTERYLGTDGRLHDQPVNFSSHIYCLFEDSRHRLWIGTKGNGLYLYTGEGKPTHYHHQPDDPQSLTSNQVYAVYEDRCHRIWVGTFERGICLAEETPGEPLRFAVPKNYPCENFHKVRRITSTSDGTIIVSASNGLVAFSDSVKRIDDITFRAYKHVPGEKSSLLTSDVMQTFVASDSTIYVATVGGGLQRAAAAPADHPSPLKLENISRLVRNLGIIFALSEDREGNIWIGCENSLNVYDAKHDKVWCFGPTYIGEETRLAEALPAYNPQTDEMVMATSSGAIRFRCGQLLQNVQETPPIVFNGVQYHDSQERMQTLLRDTLEVAADRRNLTIYFSAIDYRDNYMVRYAYKLDGIDETWNYTGRERSISWNNLPHGHHRLLVRSTNSHGTWVDNTRTLHLFVHPTFWESWQGKSVQALILIIAVIIAVWIYRLRIKADMERRLDTMKLQFFTDISHKLRTPLTLIGGPITEVLDAGGLTETARTHLEMVKRNASRMLEMVNHMLAYSKEKHIYISDENAELANEGLPTAVGKEAQPDETGTTNTPSATADPSKPHLLVVEDNDDLRAFLSSILTSEYTVSLATNGREGLEMARKEHPDFILTDVMMPKMDGLTMVHHLKEEKETSHIPIVILSAKASMDDRIEGLKAGVNDYITKPFSATYLKQRMANIIQNQRMVQQNYLEQIKGTAEPPVEEAQVIRLAPIDIVDTDKQIMEKLLAYIDANIENADLKIEDLASAVCLGRTVFYNKVKTLVGMSPVELLRQIRIQRAEEMIGKSNEPLSRIAYLCGFNDPRYFGKCFKQQTGLSPSEYREKKRGEKNADE